MKKEIKIKVKCCQGPSVTWDNDHIVEAKEHMGSKKLKVALLDTFSEEFVDKLLSNPVESYGFNLQKPGNKKIK